MKREKLTGTVTIIRWLVAKKGAIAGPRLLEHRWDRIVYFEGEWRHTYRISRVFIWEGGSRRKALTTVAAALKFALGG